MWRVQNYVQPQPQRHQPTTFLGYNHAASVAEVAAAAAAHGQVGRQIAQLNSPAAAAEAIVTPAHVTTATRGPTVTTHAPRPIAKPIARANATPGFDKHQTEIVAAPIRMPIASCASVTSLDAQHDVFQEDPLAKHAAKTAAEPQTAAVAAAAAPGPSNGIPISKRNTATTGPARRGQGNTCVTRGEVCALAALEEIFPGKVFEKVRPEWLINDRTGRLLEIDLYNHELRIGVEHNGQSHYVFPNSLHKTRAEFDAQAYRDRLKLELCTKAGVLLIHVPFTVPHGAMETYIRSEIDRLSSD